MNLVELAAGCSASRIGFGCCPMGAHGWGDTETCDFENAVHAACDAGITLFDTADVYGRGLSEERLGRALAGRRSQVLVASKAGVRLDQSGRAYFDSSPGWIEAAVDRSLTRLNIDCIDLYQLHRWDGVTPFEEIASTFAKLQRLGKIRFYGVTNIDPVALGARCATFSFEYSVCRRVQEALIAETLDTTDCAFLAWGSLAQGMASGKYSAQSSFDSHDRRSRSEYASFHGDGLIRSLRIVECLKEIAGRSNVLPAQIALAWVLTRFRKTVALTGIKSAEQAVQNAGADSIVLSPGDVSLLDNISSVPCA